MGECKCRGLGEWMAGIVVVEERTSILAACPSRLLGEQWSSTMFARVSAFHRYTHFSARIKECLTSLGDDGLHP